MKHRFQPLSPKIATSALQALTTLIANAVRYQKPMEPEWTSVYEVMPAACVAARPSSQPSSNIPIPVICQTGLMWLIWLTV